MEQVVLLTSNCMLQTEASILAFWCSGTHIIAHAHIWLKKFAILICRFRCNTIIFPTAEIYSTSTTTHRRRHTHTHIVVKTCIEVLSIQHFESHFNLFKFVTIFWKIFETFTTDIRLQFIEQQYNPKNWDEHSDLQQNEKQIYVFQIGFVLTTKILHIFMSWKKKNKQMNIHMLVFEFSNLPEMLFGMSIKVDKKWTHYKQY